MSNVDMMTKQKRTMAERLNIGGEIRELKLGCTFNPKNTTAAFHTLKYDFKPASVDVNKVATVDVGLNNQITVTVPNLINSGMPYTVYKGNHRKYTKECIIIFDKRTGDMTLEKLNHNIQVKKTRNEVTAKIGSGPSSKVENSTIRISTKTKVSTGSRKNHIIDYRPRNSPMQQGSPSASIHKSPPSAPAWSANNSQATLPSIPMIFNDDDDTISTVSGDGAEFDGYPVIRLISESCSGNVCNSTSSPGGNNSIEHQKPKQIPQQTQQVNFQLQQHTNQKQKQHLQTRLQYQQPILQALNNQLNQTNIAPINVETIKSNNNSQYESSLHHTASQPMENGANALKQEYGILSSSDSSSDTDSSVSNSESDSNESTTDHTYLQGNLSESKSSNYAAKTTKRSLLPQHSSTFIHGSLTNDLLRDDLQLSDSNSSHESV